MILASMFVKVVALTIASSVRRLLAPCSPPYVAGEVALVIVDAIDRTTLLVSVR
jgi:hypothetical protein